MIAAAVREHLLYESRVRVARAMGDLQRSFDGFLFAGGEASLAAICCAAPEPVYVFERDGEDEREHRYIDPWPFDEKDDPRALPAPASDEEAVQRRLDLLTRAAAFLHFEIALMLQASAESSALDGACEGLGRLSDAAGADTDQPKGEANAPDVV